MLSPIIYAEPTTEGVKILIADDFEYLIDFIEAHLSGCFLRPHLSGHVTDMRYAGNTTCSRSDPTGLESA